MLALKHISSLKSRKVYKPKQRAFLLTGCVISEAKYRLPLKQDGEQVSFEQHAALKQFQHLPMLGMNHMSDKKAAEKSQPPAVGGSKPASTMEVSVALLSQAANAWLSSPTPYCTENISSTTTRFHH